MTKKTLKNLKTKETLPYGVIVSEMYEEDYTSKFKTLKKCYEFINEHLNNKYNNKADYTVVKIIKKYINI